MDDTSRRTSADAGRALVPYALPTSRAPGFRPARRHVMLVAGFAAVFGVGAVGTQAARIAWAHHGSGPAAAQVDATAQTLRRLQEEVARLKGSVDTLRTAADTTRQDDSLRNLKRSVETLKTDIQQARATDGSTLQQIAAKLADRDPNARLTEIASRLDRMERAPKAVAGTTKSAEASPKPDRPVAPAVTPVPFGPPAPPTRPLATAAAPDPAAARPAMPPTTSAPARSTATVVDSPAPRRPLGPVTTVGRASPPLVKADDRAEKAAVARPPLLDAWVVRDVYDGLALVEARQGDIREVRPGTYLPGAGQVRSIERRGRDWVVLTSRGVIAPSTF